MVKIRLKRTGGKNWISFRIVVCDIRAQRDGRMLEELGYYDPRRSDEKLDVARLEYWVGNGAIMSAPSLQTTCIKRAFSGLPRSQHPWSCWPRLIPGTTFIWQQGHQWAPGRLSAQKCLLTLGPSPSSWVPMIRS